MRSWADFEYLPGARQAVGALKRDGLAVVVVTNQRGVARGHMSSRDVEEIHRRMCADFEHDGEAIDAVFYCPHEKESCDCRKPRLGMFHAAARALPRIDVRDAVVIGDAASDMQAAAALGVPGVLVAESGTPVAERLARGEIAAVHRAASLQDAAAWLLDERRAGRCRA